MNGRESPARQDGGVYLLTIKKGASGLTARAAPLGAGHMRILAQTSIRAELLSEKAPPGVADLPVGPLDRQLRLGARNNGEHISVKVNRTALMFGVWEHLSHSFLHTQAFVSRDQFHTI